MKKRIIAIIGEAGSGKDSLIEKLIKSKELFHKIIPCTTRPLRENEIDGVQYHFISMNEFWKYATSKHDYIIDQTCFNGWYYGTRYEDLVYSQINILSANPAAARTLLKNPNLNTQIVYVRCDDRERLIRSLQREKYPDIKEILRRYDSDLKDFKYLDFNYYILVNNNTRDLYKSEQIIKRELEHFKTLKKLEHYEQSKDNM